MQFSLRSFLVFVGLLCGYLAMTFAMPVVLSLLGLTLFSFFLPPLIIGGIVYGRDAVRAFWIGCAAPGSVLVLVAMYLGAASLVGLGDVDAMQESGRWICAGLAFCHIATAAYGGGMVLIRWFFVGRKNSAASADIKQQPKLIHRRVILDEPLTTGQENARRVERP